MSLLLAWPHLKQFGGSVGGDARGAAVTAGGSKDDDLVYISM